jgi:DsbC/DsbD-like thiol-disulfide interchange protein
MQQRIPDPTRPSYLAALAAAAVAAGSAPTPAVAVDAATSVAVPQGAVPGLAPPQVAAPNAVPANLVHASLAPALVRAPGGGDAIAISVTIAPEWHIYWRNPGDSGAAPSVKLQLPEGWSAGALTYPRPEILGDEDERTFGYSGTVHLLVPVRRPEGWQGTLDVRGELSWLACKRSCVAGRSAIEGKLAADAASLVDAPASRSWPVAMPEGSSAAVSVTGTSRELRLSIPNLPESAKVRFIPDDCAGIRWGDGTGPFELRWIAPTRHWTLQTPISVNPADAPGGIPRTRGLVVVGGEPTGATYFVDIPVPAAPTLTGPEPAR